MLPVLTHFSAIPTRVFKRSYRRRSGGPNSISSGHDGSITSLSSFSTGNHSFYPPLSSLRNGGAKTLIGNSTAGQFPLAAAGAKEKSDSEILLFKVYLSPFLRHPLTSRPHLSAGYTPVLSIMAPHDLFPNAITIHLPCLHILFFFKALVVLWVDSILRRLRYVRDTYGPSPPLPKSGGLYMGSTGSPP